MLRRLFILGIISLVLLGITSCDKSEKAKNISLEKKEVIEETVKPTEENHLRIAVGSMITPKVGFAYYKQLLDYIGKKLGRPVQFIDREGYASVNNAIKGGDIDIAFVCSRPYVEGHDEFGIELLVAPQVNGKTVYYSYIIASSNSPIKRLEELRGKSFAFTDPISNTGKLVPTYMLAKMGETPDTFFKKYIYTSAHDKSIMAVAQGIVDGAAVDSLIWEYLNHTNPELTSKTRVIEKSPPYGIPPVVARPGLDSKLKERIKLILLNAHKDPEGQGILKNMQIEKFVIVEDSIYDSIRKMKLEVARKEGKEQKRK